MLEPYNLVVGGTRFVPCGVYCSYACVGVRWVFARVVLGSFCLRVVVVRCVVFWLVVV